MQILGRFTRRSASLVGVDIGSSAVKAVELTRGAGGEVTARAGVQPVPRESIVKGAIVDRPAVADALRSLFDRVRIRSRSVALSLPGSAVVAREITMPRMSRAELAGSIAWEAEQHIPFDLRDVNLDYQVVDGEAESNGRPVMVVLLAAAKKTTIAEYADAVTRVGCVPTVVDVAAFSLQNACAMNCGLEGAGLVALLNAGASTINVNIVRGGRSVFTREIAAGGDAVTNALQTEFGLSFEEAERLKTGSAIRGVESMEVGSKDIEPAVREVTDDLLLEVEKTFDYFAASQVSGRIERIVLSGGLSRERGFAEAMSRRFGAPLERFDPFREMTVEGVGTAVGERDDVAAVAGVATGLALRRSGDR